MAFRAKRWTVANILPIAFIVWTILVVWGLHMAYRLLPLLQLWLPQESRNAAMVREGTIEAIITQFFTVMTLICFFRAITTDPGSVPSTAEWTLESSARSSTSLKAVEVKQTGERRFCKWCSKYKPDRCHHCRVCNSCILRMDHHCPWIANCIGFRNHKFFLLLIMYALLNAISVAVGMTSAVSQAVYVSSPTALPVSPQMNRFLLVFGLTVACIMTSLLLVFFTLHLWLVWTATTTIEFCEKRTRRAAGGQTLSYNLGPMKNLKQAFGPYISLWLLPCSLPEGSGLSFETLEATQDGPVDRPVDGPVLVKRAEGVSSSTFKAASPEAKASIEDSSIAPAASKDAPLLDSAK